MSVDRWDLVDGTMLTSGAGHKVMVDGMAGMYIRVTDQGGATPLPDPGWMAILPSDLADHVNSGRWSIMHSADYAGVEGGDGG